MRRAPSTGHGTAREDLNNVIEELDLKALHMQHIKQAEDILFKPTLNIYKN